MAETKKKKKKSIPLLSQEKRMDYLTNLAMELAERKLRNGTASSQIISSLLQLGTQKTKLELKKLEADVRLSEAKKDQIQESIMTGDMVQEVINAFRKYSGHKEDDDE